MQHCLIELLSFSQSHTISNIDIIANFVVPFVCNFLLYVQHKMLANERINISGNKRVTYQGCGVYWFSSFPMVQLKRSWQYWHFGIEEFVKTLLAVSLIHSNIHK